MEIIVGLFQMTVWYLFNMPAFVPVALCVSAFFAIRFPAPPNAIWQALGLAASSAFYADIGFVVVWIAFTGQFSAFIGFPLFFLWIIGFVLAVPAILAVWVVVKSISKKKA